MSGKLLRDSKVDAIYNYYNPRPNQAWRTALVKSVTESVVDGIPFPTFPPADLQRIVQGAPNELAIRGSLHFREQCWEVAAECNALPQAGDTLIDFGAGWGRISRTFMRDFQASRIFGIEPFDFILEARKHNPYVNFLKSDPEPPLPFSDGFATHLVSYSIFSHLNERLLSMWMAEFARVMKKGGLMFLTLLGTSFLQGLVKVHEDLERGKDLDFWRKLVAARLPKSEIPRVIESIAQGQFHFLADPKANSEEYAESFLTDRWFALNASENFDIVGYLADGTSVQDVIVLRRK